MTNDDKPQPIVQESAASQPQDINVDVDQLFKMYFKDIVGPKRVIGGSSSFLTSMDKDKLFQTYVGNGDSEINSKFTQNNPFESYCHVFFRFFGFPVVEPGGTFFNTGYDPDNKNKEKIDKIISISNKFIKSNASKLSNKRQFYPQQIFNIFASQNINSSILLLSTSNKRSFSSPMAKEPDADMFSLALDSQNTDEKDLYTIPCTIPKGNEVSSSVNMLSEFQDQYENKPNLQKGLRRHIIRPFIVDPRIACYAGSSVYAAPFIKDDKFDKTALETLIEERISLPVDSGDYVKSQIEFFKKLKTDEIAPVKELISSTSKESFFILKSLSEFYTVMKPLCKALYKNIESLREVLKDYHYLPLPPQNGILNGSIQYQPIYSKDPANCIKDIEIQNIYIKNISKELEAQVVQITQEGKKEVNGSFSSSQYNPLFKLLPQQTASAPVAAITDSSATSLNTATSDRRKACEKAARNIEIIEKIMGEFTGFGLIDVLVIYYALSSLETKYLLGMLDDDAYRRFLLKYDYTIDKEEKNVINCLKQLEKKVALMYSFAESIYSFENDR